MDFPDVFHAKEQRRAAIIHPELVEHLRVTEVVLEKDIMLHFPYHSFNPVIDLLRESAMDPDVILIKITLYRLATDSKVINALINAARNGKEVRVVLELKARFDEEANLEWKERLELEGVKVLIGFHNMKVHAKVCMIRKRIGKRIVQYGFVSTGNLNERTSKVYADHLLLTSNRKVMADINRLFECIEAPKTDFSVLKNCKTLMVCPTNMRNEITHLINKEIKSAKQKKPASIILKVNSLSDHTLIEKLYEAAHAGVEIKLIVRGIFCAVIDDEKFKKKITAISIVDEYLEHARVMIFHNDGKQKVYISSADWMVRNLDHRIEAAVPMFDRNICNEIQDIIKIQLRDNVKARILDVDLSNRYVTSNENEKIRSQLETYRYLYNKTIDISANNLSVYTSANL